MSSRAIWVRRGESGTHQLLIAIAVLSMLAVGLVSALPLTASAASVGSPDPETVGVHLYNAGSDTQGFQTPPPSTCLGEGATDPTNETVNIGVQNGVLYFIGDEPSEVISFNLGADLERQGGTPDTTVGDVNIGLSAIDDYGFVGNSLGNSDDNSNYDAQTGGDVSLQLDIDGNFAAPGGTDLAVIVPDGVVATGTLQENPTDPFGNLDGNEIFIFEDAETSGMIIDLYGPGGAGPYTIDVVDYQRNPDTAGAADDTLITIDLDSLPGFTFPYVESITLTDDGAVIDPNVSSCPGGALLDTSLEIDAVATRTDTVLAGPPSIDIEKATNGEDADTTTGPEIPVGGTVTWTYVVTNTGEAPLLNVTVADDQGVAVDCGGGSNIVAGPLAPNDTFTCTGTGVAEAGQYTNNSIVVGTPASPSGDPIVGANVTDADPSNYIGLAPAIDIEKATNGADSDVAPGESLAVGSAVTWTYVVTNTGSTNLVNATVADSDPAVTVDCGNGTAVIAVVLAPADTATCSATGTAAFGPYTNDSTVVADPADAAGVAIPGAPQVTDADPSNYTGAASATIDIEKATNGEDADVVTGPTVVVGETVTWTYVVTNTGDVDLTTVTVTDDLISAAGISCSNGSNVVAGPIAPGDSFNCTATGIATAGQYTNIGSVEGVPTAADGTPIAGIPNPTDTDPSNYIGVTPGINLEKATNGQDADVAPGPALQVGDTVTWTYTVANTGGAVLQNVLVADSDATITVTCPAGNPIPTLGIGETVVCSATGVAGLGQYMNDSTAEGQPLDSAGQPVGAPIGDADPSHYITSAAPAVQIEKDTNGFDSDVAPGQTILVGETVTWTYVVTNTGDVALTDLTVADDDATLTVDCGNGTNIVAGPIAPAGTFSCTASAPAAAGPYTNDSTVTGTPSDPAGNPLGLPAVTDDDPSNYLGGDPGIDIEKATNLIDADAAPGPAIPVGGAVTWTYVVTNNGNQTLTSVTVTDDDPTVVVSCATGTANVIASLAAGETATCTANGTAVAGDYENVASVTGTDPAGGQQTDADPSHYFGADPSIDIEKSTNGEDSDDAPGENLAVGSAVTWEYVVTNTGNTTLINATVVDSEGVTVDCGGPIPALAPGETVTCTGTGTAVAGQYTNDSTVTADPADPSGAPLVDPAGMPLAPVTDDDPSNYFGGEPGLTLEKDTNGEDADTGTGPIVAVGETITWTYVVTNSGNQTLTAVTVTDDDASVTVDCGDGTNVIATLAAGATESCTATGTAVAGQYENTGSASGTDPQGGTQSATDDSHYFAAEPSVDIEKATNTEDADAAPGPAITVGGDVNWTYVVTNDGNVDLTAVTVTDDDAAVTVDCGDGTNVVALLAVGDSATCTATGTAVAGDYENTGSVTGDPVDPAGNPLPSGPVTDDDLSHYNGTVDPTGSIGDTVWIDLNADGVIDADEVGIPGVDVILTDSSGAEQTLTTNADGMYLFTGLVGGDYTVTIDAATLPAGYEQTYDATSPLDNESSVTIADGGQDLDQDFGYVPPGEIEIEKDTEGDDADVAPGVTLQVGDAVVWTYAVTNTGEVVLSDITVTDDKVDAADIVCDGATDNTIATLAPGATVECSARGTVTEGAYTNTGSASGTDPLGNVVADDDPSNYVGVTEPLGTIGDTVWFDENGDGNQQASEVGFRGVTLTLVDSDGNTVATEVTDDDGKYLFTNVPAGSYTVNVDKTLGGIPAEAIRTFDSDGDLDNSSPVTIAAGGEDLDQDFGYTLPLVGTIGDTVWYDNNDNGIQDADEDGIADVRVILLDEDGNEVDTATTNADGMYLFSDIAGGTYKVVIDENSLPAGVSLVTDPDDVDDGMSMVTIADGESDLDQDFGYLQPARVGDFIFVDANSNGIQDDDEDGVEGATVTLFVAGSDGQPTGDPVATTTTDADGGYSFTGVDASNSYVIQVAAPAGSVITTADAGTDDEKDSDIDPTTGISSVFTVEPGGANLTLDAGIVPAEASITIEKTTNLSDADDAPGPSLAVGSVVEWRYTVTNTGGITIDDIVVTDNKEGVIDCPKSTLTAGESMVCLKAGTVLSGQYTNMGTVAGTPVGPDGSPIGSDVDDEDPSHYLGEQVVNATVTPPTATPRPTSTPRPAATARPTATPAPTATPVPQPPLAVTGRNSTDLSVVAGALVLVGSSLLLIGRRREEDRIEG